MYDDDVSIFEVKKVEGSVVWLETLPGDDVPSVMIWNYLDVDSIMDQPGERYRVRIEAV